jgi:hypothetical protein
MRKIVAAPLLTAAGHPDGPPCLGSSIIHTGCGGIFLDTTPVGTPPLMYAGIRG